MSNDPNYIPEDYEWQVIELTTEWIDGDCITTDETPTGDYVHINDDADNSEIIKELRANKVKAITGHRLEITFDSDVIWIDDPYSGENLLQLWRGDRITYEVDCMDLAHAAAEDLISCN